MVGWVGLLLSLAEAGWLQGGPETTPLMLETAVLDNNGLIDVVVQDTTELMDGLALKAYQPNIGVVYIKVADSQHNQSVWVIALPDFLIWAFPLGP